MVRLANQPEAIARSTPGQRRGRRPRSRLCSYRLAFLAVFFGFVADLVVFLTAFFTEAVALFAGPSVAFLLAFFAGAFFAGALVSLAGVHVDRCGTHGRNPSRPHAPVLDVDRQNGSRWRIALILAVLDGQKV